MAKLIKIDGTIEEVTPKNKRKGFTLQELYDLIGCELIEPIEYTKGKFFICDEEFRLKDGWEQRRNKTANDMIIAETGDDWDLAGNIVICSKKEFF